MTLDTTQAEALLKEREELIKREIPSEDSTSREEKLILMQEILNRKPKVIVETGTHRGLTTCYLGLAAKEVGAHIHTYDPYDWGAYGNFAKFLDLPITYYKEPGKSCAVETVDFFFCDGFHEKEHVVQELDTILPKLSEGAVVYFHDTLGRSESCDVPGGIEHHGLNVEYLATLNGMAKYIHGNKTKGDDSDTKHKTSVPKRNSANSRKADL